MRTAFLAAALVAACTPDTDGDGFRGRRDCDESDPAVHAGAAEICDGRDNDCDGFVDEGVALVAYRDADGDGFGDPDQARRVCRMPPDGVAEGTDCDDTHPGVYPGAPERCDGRDDDCDGLVDDGVLQTFYVDADGDGYGADTVAPGGPGCTPPPGAAIRSGDCDDTDPRVHAPDAPEICDGADNDCDGLVDEDLPLRPVWADQDGDGAGDPAHPDLGCGTRPGWADNDADCDDADPDRAPGRPDPDNGLDDDCDGFIDEWDVPGDLPDLPTALAGAADGAVIQLGPGTFLGTADLTGRDLVLAGTGCSATVLYADGAGPVVTADRGRIVGLTLAGGAAERGGGLAITGDVAVVDVCVEGNAAAADGGGIAVLTGTATVEGGRIARNAAGGMGGGIYVHDGASLIARRTVFDGNVGHHGGNVAVGAATAHLAGVVIADGRATGVGTVSGDGGGLYVQGIRGDRAQVRIDHATFRGNRSRYGQAIFDRFTDLEVTNTAFVDHPIPRAVVFERDGLWDAARVAFFGNGGRDHRFGLVADAVRGAPRFVGATDLRPTPRSAHVDVGLGSDPDGSPADLGAWGGPRPLGPPVASPDQDTDADGIPDGWELRYGLSPYAADAGDDPDGDGLSNAGEWAADTDPTHRDTDGDGVDDPTEIAAGDDPTDPSDHAPVSDAGPDRRVLVGVPVPLAPGATVDPDGDPLTHLWSVAPPPGGTAPPDIPTASGAFVPDAAGTWTVTHAVSDGRTTRTDTAIVIAHEAVVVPDDAADLPEAADLAGNGGAVALRAGTWSGLDLSGRDLTVFGIEPEATVDGGGVGRVFTADSGEALALAHLTVRGGNVDGHGGGILALDGSVALLDVHLADLQASGDGGGIYVRGTLVAVDSTLSGARALRGGGVYALGDVTWIRGALTDNHAVTDGGAFHLEGVGNGRHRIANAVLQENGARSGAAVYHLGTGSIATLEHVAIVGNEARNGIVRAQVGTVVLDSVLLVRNGPGVVLSRSPFGRYDLVYGRHVPGGGALTADPADPNATARGTSAGPVQVARWRDDGLADDVWFAELGGSLVDAGRPDRADIDGSRADLGPGGGPDAPRTRQAYLVDTDGDGMSDGWEVQAGLDPTAPDAGGDLDGDGLSNGEEHALGTAPDQEDTDSDGVADGDEVAAGDDPTDPTDHRPLARIAPIPRTEVGTAVVLDGSASRDPDGALLSYAWRVVGAPAGSALAGVSLEPVPTPVLLPDVRGTYTVRLVVSDPTAASLPATATVEVFGPVRIPEDFPTVADALPHLADGDVLALSPGVHRVALGNPRVRLTLRGAGAAATTIRPVGARPIVDMDGAPDVTLEDLTVRGAVGITGGAVACRDGRFTARRVRFVANVASQGGALYLRRCDVQLTDVRFEDNASGAGGGAIHASESDLVWQGGAAVGNVALGNGGALYASRGHLVLHRIVFADNATASPGGAAYFTTATLEAAHLTVVDNTSRRAALFLTATDGEITSSAFSGNGGVGLQVAGGGTVEAAFNAFHGNGDGATRPPELVDANAVLEPPRFVGGGDWRLRADSPLVDAAAPGAADPDGSPADIGAYGGPLAPPDFDLWIRDADGDGLPDGWEEAAGMAVGTDDGDSDGDGDGLTALEEWLAGTDPTAADTDGDGLPDGEDPDPLSAGGRPIADAGSDREGTIGAPIPLDGSGSFDPDGAIASWRWTLLAAPGRAAAFLTDADRPVAHLVADRPGRYAIALVVGDGATTSAPDTVNVDVPGDLWVPEDYPTPQAAVDVAMDGATITVAAGTWPLVADLGSRRLTLVGAGRDATLLTGGGQRLLTVDGGGLILRDLTLADGLGQVGGALRIVDGSAELIRVAIRDSAAVDGGGAAILRSTLTATDVAFTGNEAARSGGGLYLENATARLHQTLLHQNRAVGWFGGGVYARSSDLELTNAIVAACTAASGGAVYLDGTPDAPGTARLRHLTAADDTAAFGGAVVHVSRGTVAVVDGVFTRIDGPIAAVGDGGALTTSYTTWHGGSPPTGFLLPIGLDGNTDDDPLLGPGWILGAGSPAIDAGDPAGGPDPDGSPPDRGAFGGPGGDWSP